MLWYLAAVLGASALQYLVCSALSDTCQFVSSTVLPVVPTVLLFARDAFEAFPLDATLQFCMSCCFCNCLVMTLCFCCGFAWGPKSRPLKAELVGKQRHRDARNGWRNRHRARCFGANLPRSNSQRGGALGSHVTNKKRQEQTFLNCKVPLHIPGKIWVVQ